MSEIVIKELRKKLGISQEKLAEKIGVHLRTIQNWEGGGVIPKAKYAILHEIELDLDAERIYAGKGKTPKPATAEIQTTPENNPFIFVPVYNFDAVGGIHASNEITSAPAYIERHVPFVGAQKDDICVHVTGNSMMPTYSSGSLLLVRKVEGWMEYFGYGLCYVLFLKDGRRILKEIQKSEIDHQRYVLCVSYNPKNPSEELPRDFIVDVYKVIMTLMNEGF